MCVSRAAMWFSVLLVAMVVSKEHMDIPEPVYTQLDDECEGDSQCAFSALQRRTSVSGEQGQGDVIDYTASEDPLIALRPDTNLRDDYLDAEDDDMYGESEADEEEIDDTDDERSTPLNVTLAEVGTVTDCHKEGVECPSGQECVIKYDRTWSQCMSCESESFGKECQKLGDYMRYAAMYTCKKTCLDTKCYNKHWCLPPYHCVVDTDLNWGQCIACKSRRQWTSACHGWKDGLYKAAKKVCHKKCRYAKK